MVSPLRRRQRSCIAIVITLATFAIVCTANEVTKPTEIEGECRLDTEKVKCLNNSFCNRTYNAIYIDKPPYVYIPMSDIFNICCGTCFVLKVKDGMYRNVLDIKNISGYDFVYPVQGQLNVEKSAGFYFLPVMSHSGFYYVTQIRKSNFELAIDSCLEMYPMLIIFVFLSMIFGFVFWLFEAYQSESEYSKAFPIGWVKGIWWGMMSLVSQGPDGTPKSLIARLLAFLWVFIAVILVGIMTSIITATMVKAYPTPSMEGKTVVTLSNRPYNVYLILKNYGKAHVVKMNDSESEIERVFELGLSKKFDGILIDKLILKIHLADLKKTKPDAYNNLKSRMYITTIKSMEDLYYGISVLDKSVYQYYISVIKAFITDNEIKIFIYRNNLQGDAKTSTLTDPVLFGIKQPFVQSGLIYCAIIIASIVLIGIIYETIRRKRKVERTEP